MSVGRRGGGRGRKVDKLSCVRFGSARYSVPSRLIGAAVLITVTGKTIRVLEPFTGQIAAEHQLVAPGEVSVIDEHYGSAQPDKPRRAPRARTDDEKQFLALGDPAAAFLAGAAAAGVSTLGREISQILSLQAAHGDAALVAALERAAEFGRWRADDVRSVLAAAGSCTTVTSWLSAERKAAAERRPGAGRRSAGAVSALWVPKTYATR